MIKLDCAICGKKQKTKVLYRQNFDLNDLSAKKFSARRTPDGRHYRFLECQNCGLIFSSPILEANKINKLYSESEFNYDIESNYLKQTYGQLLTTYLADSETKGMRLLEIGCGNGFFLEEARKRGMKEVYGIEPSFKAVSQALSWVKKRIKVDVLRPNLFEAKSFDVVCCFHTLDHIVSLNQFLKTTLKYLKKGGGAIFVVHDTKGLSVKLFGERSAIFDIEHIYLFNKETLGKIFSENGFIVDEVRELKNTYPLNYWFRMVPMPAVLKKLGNFVLSKTGLGSLPLSVKPGNIAIFASKP